MPRSSASRRVRPGARSVASGVGRIVVGRAGPALWTVELRGEHDISTVGSIEDELAAIFAQGTTVVVDLLSPVTFMDSSVLRELIVANRRAEADDDERMALVAPAAGFAARLID